MQSGYQGEHPAFKHPPRDSKIWRYLDFAKFVDLLDSQALFFACADMMADPWEGAVSPGSQLQLAAIMAEGGWPVDMAVRHARMHAETWTAKRREYFLSCWHLSNYESAAMWKLYAGGDDRGIAVQSTFGRFEDCFDKPSEVSIYAGLVRYMDPVEEGIYDKAQSFGFDIVMNKRPSFQYEREVRGVVWISRDPPTGGIKVPVNLEKLVERICVSPMAPNYFVDVVHRVVERYGMSLPVDRSKLYDGPLH